MAALPTMTADDEVASDADVAPDDSGIEQHPDRHEEQHAEDVPKRHHVAQRLMGVFGFVDHEAGDERPERKREAERRRRIADPESDGRRRQQEQFPGIPARHERHQRGPRAWRRGRSGRAAGTHVRSPAITRIDAAGRVAQLRQHDHQRHDGEILHDQHAEHHAARERPDPALRLQASSERPSCSTTR